MRSHALTRLLVLSASTPAPKQFLIVLRYATMCTTRSACAARNHLRRLMNGDAARRLRGMLNFLEFRIQTSFLPIICDRDKPPPSTADADCIAIQNSTERRFLCKSARKHKLLPATEWICASLARALEIPVADWAVVQMKGLPEMMFGSVWEGGGQPWAAALPNVSNGGIFSEAFAFDLCVHNVDRHLNNYLYLELAGDIVAKLIDASRAFIYHGLPIPGLPMLSSENTMRARPVWNNFHPYEKARALAIASRILALPDDWMADTIEGMPADWMMDVTKQDLDNWWRTERPNRVAEMGAQL